MENKEHKEKVSHDLPLNIEGPVCPVPLPHHEKIVLGHGSGGKMTRDLIRSHFLPEIDNNILAEGNDFARICLDENTQNHKYLAISTDNHIISPLFFPGGDIGRLSVCGTVNDVSMSGAIPKYITAGFIIEEGTTIQIIKDVLSSMRIAAEEAGIQIIAGDTKVAENGKVDKLFINTTGIGYIPDHRMIGGQYARPGDQVLISGTIGDHGIAVLAARDELGFETNIQSDVAPLNHMIQEVIRVAPNTHVLRDPTRGGLGTALTEIATQSGVCITIDENRLPIQSPVRAACEMLGFDPLYIANEGKVIVIVPEDEAEKALIAMRANPYGTMATRIGTVLSEPKKRVLLNTLIGGTRIINPLSGEILPRIC